MNFKLFLETLNIEKNLQFRIRGVDAQEFLNNLNVFPQQTHWSDHQGVTKFYHWMQDNMQVRRGGSIILTVPARLQFWKELGFLTTFLHRYRFQHGEPYKKILHQVGPLLTQINIARVFLVEKLHEAPKEWRENLYDALWNNPDANIWLAYADYLEERGDRDGVKIRGLFSK
jgi:uncharacterized protein (TIGR02996 family)